MKSVIAVIAAGSIGQAIARRVSAGKHAGWPIMPEIAHPDSQR